VRTETQPAADAYLITSNDVVLQAYLQTYPFLTGPDEELNGRGLALLRAGPSLRRPTLDVSVNLLEQNDFPPSSDAEARVRKLCAAAALRKCDALLDDYHWKLAVADAKPDKVLSFGCGDGHELIMLRAMFPMARIEALDWTAKVSATLLSAADVSFRKADLIGTLDEPERYDLIFSNHTVEHFYEPDRLLRKLRARLSANGVLVCSMPLDGCPDDTFRRSLALWAATPSAVGHLDAAWIDPGHPWKANASDVAETLKTAGFSSVQIFQRAFNVPRGKRLDEHALHRFRRRMALLHALTIKPVCALCGPFASNRRIRRAIFGAMARLPWGNAKLKNAQSREIVFVAR
jgi:SAM-dependent methyltransferase